MAGAKKSDELSPSAWAHLVVGSVMGGFAIWKLVVKAASIPVADFLVDVAKTYDDARNFLLSPLALLHLDLSPFAKDELILSLVLATVTVRSLWVRPNTWVLLATLGEIVFVMILLGGKFGRSITTNELVQSFCIAMISATVFLPLFVVGALQRARSRAVETGPMLDSQITSVWMMLINLGLLVAWSVTLLLLNSAG